MILDKQNEPLIQFYDTYYGKLYTRYNCPNCDYCFVPKFVDQIDVNFLSKIDGILDMDKKLSFNGHMIFLNIASKPMFCVVPEGEDLFPNVFKYKIIDSIKNLKMN